MARSAYLTVIIQEQPTSRPGDTIEIFAVTQNEDGSLVEHSSPQVTITDPNGTVVVAGSSMSSESTGTSRYLYTTSSTSVEGTYLVYAQASVTLLGVARTEASNARFVLRARKP